jgi:hypothetical protein
MVWDNQPKASLHLFDGSHLLAIRRKGLLQVFGSMDTFDIHSCDRWEQFQLGRNNLQETKHMCAVGSDIEGRRGTNFLHGLIPLDVMCARNVFVDMNLSWHVAELSIHVYFSVLWKNRYKKYYSLICDEFITRIYFVIFKKECPRLSSVAKKKIAKVGHWYLDESAQPTSGCSRPPEHHISYQLMSHTSSSWEKFVIRPSSKAIMPHWSKTRNGPSYPTLSM